MRAMHRSDGTVIAKLRFADVTRGARSDGWALEAIERVAMESKQGRGLARRDLIALGAAGSAAMVTSAANAQDAASPGASAAGPDGVPPLKLTTDYAALRRERLAQLDPEMRAVYDAAAAAPPLRQVGLARMRGGRSPRPDTGLPKGVTAYDIKIPGPAGDIPTRVYMPEGAKTPVGVYLSTHGGGWVFGNGLGPSVDAGEVRNVLDWGCAVVHPDYRIAPEHKFPAAIEDCYAAYRYVLDNGPKMGLDTNRIGIGGGCAGANIGTVVSLMARDAKLKLPAIQYLWSGAFDMRPSYRSYHEFADGYGLRTDDAMWVESCYLRSEEDRWDWRASPVLAKTLRGAPPALFWAGEWEILRDEIELYANRMRDAGCTVHFIEGPQQGHGFIYLHADTKYARQATPEINRIMRSYIGPEAARR